MKKNFSAVEALEDLAARWHGLRASLFAHGSPSDARSALLRYLLGVKLLLGVPVAEVVTFLAEERDPLFAQLVRATDASDWRYVINRLLEWTDTE